MLTNESLRYIDENTFAEAAPPEDRSRPLEWRRSFITVAFQAIEPRVEYIYTVNEVDHFASLSRDPSPSEKRVVTASEKRRIRITFNIQHERFRDTIFYTEETEKGSGVYRLRRPRSPIELSLIETEPCETRGPYEQGALPGLAFIDDLDQGSGGLCIESGAPAHQLNEIAELVKSGYANALHVVVRLQSFSYEVDDALREWYHPRDLFIHGSATQAALLSVRLQRSEPAPQSVTTDDTQDTVQEDTIAIDPSPTKAQPDYTSVLKGIKTALWLVAGLLLLGLFK